MKVTFDDQMAFGVTQLREAQDDRRGPYVDLKLQPERVSELPEARDWPALGAFIRAVNETNVFRTSGCAGDPKDTSHCLAAPYVDIACDDPRLRNMKNGTYNLLNCLMKLDGHEVAPGFELRLANSGVELPGETAYLSLRLWLIGTREEAEEVFPLLTNALAQQTVPEYLRFVHGDLAESQLPYGCPTLVLVAGIASLVTWAIMRFLLYFAF